MNTFDFKSPAELVLLYDEDIFSGKASLHPWQLNLLLEFGKVKPTSKSPYRLALVAANGSGKDKYIIAPFCLWFILSKANAEVIVTSSSAQQLDNQTEKYLRYLGQRINAKHNTEILRIIKRKIECSITNSTIRLFATDEPGKAEGYHPLTPESEMAIVTNETKSIPDDIMEALMRCTGFNYWLEVSSPGQPSGHFYRTVTTGTSKVVRVTSYDCPHISRDEIEYDKLRLGESSAIFRSKHLALFTSVEQKVIITREMLDKMMSNPPPKIGSYLRAGLDFGAGGDETVLSVWEGNTQIAQECMTCEDTERTADWLVQLFEKYGLQEHNIYADDGGIGRNYFYSILKRGWKINRVLFNSRASNKKEFLNLGAELWYKFSRYVQMGCFNLLNDSKLLDQLSSRQYAIMQGGRIRLVKKSELRSQGYPSPDRADAAVLANIPISLDMAESWALGKTFEKHKQSSKPRLIDINKALLVQESDYYKVNPQPPQQGNIANLMAYLHANS